MLELGARDGEARSPDEGDRDIKEDDAKDRCAAAAGGAARAGLDARVTAPHIGVMVERGVVTLTGAVSSYADLARAARHAPEWDALVPDERIRSTVADGWVTLEGEVDFWHQRQDAARAVRHLAGVRGVTNRPLISAPTIAAEEVREEIEAALERRADRAAHRIRVAVADGAVTLTGPVHSLAEKRAALGAARGTPGVRAVHDHLVIDRTEA